jgi:hypothetical protein
MRAWLLSVGLVLRPLADGSRLELVDVRLEAMPRWLRSLVLSSSSMRGVRHLVIHECSGLTDELLERLFASAPLLVSVSIRSAPAVTGHGLRLPALQDLVLQDCDVDDDAVAAAVSDCQSLLSLTLGGAARLRLLPIRSRSLSTLNLVHAIPAPCSPAFFCFALLGSMLARELTYATLPEPRHGSTPRCPSG